MTNVFFFVCVCVHLSVLLSHRTNFDQNYHKKKSINVNLQLNILSIPPNTRCLPKLTNLSQYKNESNSVSFIHVELNFGVVVDESQPQHMLQALYIAQYFLLNFDITCSRQNYLLANHPMNHLVKGRATFIFYFLQRAKLRYLKQLKDCIENWKIHLRLAFLRFKG